MEIQKKSLRVGIADDMNCARVLVASLLKTLGHQVVFEACSGRELIEQCVKERPDLVVTDNVMPDLTGVEAAAEIYNHCVIPVILLSAFSDPEVVISAERKHVVVYLVKPVDKSILEAAIDIALRRFAEEHRNDETGSDAFYELESTTAARSATGSFQRRHEVSR